MNKKQSKRQRDMKAKLMAAICMLLVSSIMMVSTTYAWFTLSTAPEVTGLSTAVGANGNLEMALMPQSGKVGDIKSSTSDSMASQAVNLANVTWGNLVDLSDNSGTTFYGLDLITLYPAALNAADGEINSAAPLSVPKYGSDGRMSGLDATSTNTGVYATDNFYPDDDAMGVRAIGTVSGMTPQQLAFRAALAAASTAASRAQKVASDSLKAEGPDLAGIAIAYATDGTDAKYTLEDVQSLLNMVNALVGYDTTTGSGDTAVTTHTDGALELIENAIKQYLIAAAASEEFGSENYSSAADHIQATELTKLETSYIPSGMTTMVKELQNSIANAEEAQSGLKALVKDANSNTTFAWSDISTSLKLLADPNKMRVNGIEVGNLNDTNEETGEKYMSEFVSSALTSGINLTMASGAGVFADIADFCGDYTATIKIPEVSYGGLNAKNVPATMSTKSSQTTPYLDQANTYVRNTLGAPSGSSSTAMPISDYYGYIIDLAFRTNAADSYLKLQTEAVDRVYSDNTANDATMGGGATMSFKTDSTTFLPNSMLNLMKCIKIVFFDPSDGNKILGYATLDADNATTAADGTISAGLVMCEADGTAKEGDDAAKIVDLEQNKAQQVSVLVYLDGEKVTNADVAFDAAESMSGTLNLQFSSSANLVPMEYTDLRQGAADGATNFNLKNVTVNGATKGQAKYANGTIAIQLADVPENSTITIKVGDAEAVTVNVTSVEISGTTYTGISYAATGVEANTPIVVTVTSTGT